MTFDIVREIGLALPDVEEGTLYGSPALKLCGSLLACVAINKSAEPESLVVAIDFEQRSAWLSEMPETYYVTNHYVDYPVVLVRLPQIQIDELRDILGSAWRFVTSQKRRTQTRPIRGKLNPARRKSRQP